MSLLRLILTTVLLIVLPIAGFSADFQQDSLPAKQKVEGLLREASTLSVNQPNKGILVLEEALGLARKNNLEYLEGEILLQLGQNQILLGNYQEGRDNLQLALGSTSILAQAEKKASCFYLIGVCNHRQGYHPGAIKNYLEAIRIYETLHDASGMLSSYSALADVYSRMNLFSLSVEYNLKGLQLLENQKDQFRQVVVTENLSTIFQNQKNPEKSREYLLKTLSLYRQLGNKAGEANTLQKLGKIALELNQPEASKAYFEQSLVIARKFQAKAMVAENLCGLGKVNYQLKDYEKANAHYREAIAIGKSLGLKTLLDEAYSGLSELYKSLNDKGKSKAFEALSTEIRDSVFNDSILKRAADLQLLYEAEKKQAQIDNYRKSEEIRDLQLIKERELRNFFIILSVVLVGFSLVVLYFFRQNRKINQELKTRYSELQQKNNAIEEQKEQLTQLNQVKDRFFSIISHDLRNSLTTTKLYFDLVSNPNFKEEDNPNLTRDISYSVQNTIDLLENLLVWASGQIKGIEIKPTAIDLFELCEENIQLVGGQASQKKIRLLNDVDADCQVLGDKEMVNLVIRNLVSNALKFTPEHGEVILLSEEDGEEIKIMVIDNGVGISPEKQAELFTQYKNTSTKGTGNEKGTGLGLMLCKEFIERNGGRIWVESEEGRGTCFTFTLPKHEIAA
ncbi:MAG: tetratricopeptide repeat-containing sensor histidine kinase [Bacteroidia bacterium]|nr:tetratricopeptide repeat-containing sensor histidine kinase [Bacteroidia bacterium]